MPRSIASPFRSSWSLALLWLSGCVADDAALPADAAVDAASPGILDATVSGSDAASEAGAALDAALSDAALSIDAGHAASISDAADAGCPHVPIGRAVWSLALPGSDGGPNAAVSTYAGTAALKNSGSGTYSVSLIADAPDDLTSVALALPLSMPGTLHSGSYEAYAASEIASPLLAGRSPIAGGSTVLTVRGPGEADGCFQVHLTKVAPDNSVAATGAFHIACGADCP